MPAQRWAAGRRDGWSGRHRSEDAYDVAGDEEDHGQPGEARQWTDPWQAAPGYEAAQAWDPSPWWSPVASWALPVAPPGWWLASAASAFSGQGSQRSGFIVRGRQQQWC
mmetsp:Transcript_21615/g.74238  ORF Transcript_21615/g.74238 Transcript_21615/m.74238 type:complete len:109 (+) Transcript_21615:689-1015(+)